MERNVYTIYAHGYQKDYADKDKRSRTWSPYQYVPFYIKAGQTLNVHVSGEPGGKAFAVIGLPSDSDKLSTHLLSEGENTFHVKNNGLLSFINHHDTESLFVDVESSHQRVPYFKLYQHSNIDWNEEMNRYHDAPYVILSNSTSDIIVSYPSAKKYIVDAHKLMENYELIIATENEVTGLIRHGKADYQLDKNRVLHLEVDRGYMYATSEYTGYNEATGAMPPLLGLSNERWGVWHENGHQRQQYPWQWSAGTGMTEVTVNIYSLFAQEAITGRATNFDHYYPTIRTYLAKKDKSYDNEDPFVKLGLFWQLRLAFGDGFYPQLHQLYRCMDDSVSIDSDDKQKQLLILTASHLVNINLSPFFSKWGIYSDIHTLVNLSLLPKLDKPIWENNNDSYHQLAMPEDKYIPELIYFKNSIDDVELTEEYISFIIDKAWYSPYHYILKLNDKYIGEIKDGVAYYCSSQLTDRGYKIIRKLNQPGDVVLASNDIFSIEVNYEGEHIVYYSSLLINELWLDVQAIYSDDSFTSLTIDTDQSTLDALWIRYEECKNAHTIKIKNKILLAQQLLLFSTIERDDRDDVNYTVQFADGSFKKYSYLVYSSGELLAELKNGKSTLPSTLEGDVWKIPANKVEHKEIDIIVNISNCDVLIRKVFVDDFILRDEIQCLSTLPEPCLSQSEIDNVRNAILNSELPYWRMMLLMGESDDLQRLYLSRTLSEVYFSGQNVNVVFSDNTIFRHYRYMLMSKSGYLSEISYGKPYYSSLSGLVWKTTVAREELDSLYIKVYVNDTWYVIDELSNKIQNMIFDYP